MRFFREQALDVASTDYLYHSTTF